MSKTRYNAVFDGVAYRHIAIAGIDRAAYESIGISNTTFYKWMAKHPSFRDAVERAKEFHRKASPEALKLGLVSYIVKCLESGSEEITVSQRIVERTVVRDRHNRILSVTETEREILSTECRGLPKWVADKIMGNASGLNEAVQKVIGAGYEIIDPSEAAGTAYMLKEYDAKNEQEN